MKKLLIIACALLLTSLSINAQTPPKIRIPGATNATYTVIPEGTSLEKGKEYFSPNGKYYLVFQKDGNLVVYRRINGTSTAIWNTGAYSGYITKCVFQDDGNLVFYDKTGKSYWNSLTKMGAATEHPEIYIKPAFGHELRIQNDGNVVIYLTQNGPVKQNLALYHTATFERN